MTKNYNSSKSNTSSVKGDEVDGPTEADIPTTKNYNSSKSNTSSVSEAPVGDGGGGGGGEDPMTNTIGYQGHLVDNTGTQSVRGEDGLTPDAGGATLTNRLVSSGGGSGGGATTGLKSTLGLMKSAFTLATIIVLVAAGADVYKMYDDHVTINLEDHITDADFWLTPDKNSIVGDIGFDIPKMGYFEKSIDTQIHLKIQESEPDLNDVFYFEYTLGSGEMIYDKFELNNLDPVTKDKIDKGEPLHIEYTVTITIVYLGVELGPTTSEVGTKVTTIQTASES